MAPFGWIRRHLYAGLSRRSQILRVLVHVLNLCTRVMGTNQISTFFASPEVDTVPLVKRFDEGMNFVPSNGMNDE